MFQNLYTQFILFQLWQPTTFFQKSLKLHTFSQTTLCTYIYSIIQFQSIFLQRLLIHSTDTKVRRILFCYSVQRTLFLFSLFFLCSSHQKREALAKKNETKMKCLSHLPFYILIFALIANKSSIILTFEIQLLLFVFCHLLFFNYALYVPLDQLRFYLVLIQNSGFINL